MICKLCQQEKKLLKKSHIIPDFMYTGIYNDKHQILLANYPNFEKIKRIPTGHYDKDILCQHCDNVVLGDLETYSSKVLFYGIRDSMSKISTKLIQSPDGLQVLMVENIDYKKFKLFLLSILWRASISKNPYFKEVILGSHEEIIRKAIQQGDPLNESDYQICILIVKQNDILPRDFILNPIKINRRTDPSFCFYMNGAFYFFTTETNPKLEIYKSGSIKKNNKIEIPVIELAFVKTLLGKIWELNLK